MIDPGFVEIVDILEVVARAATGSAQLRSFIGGGVDGSWLSLEHPSRMSAPVKKGRAPCKTLRSDFVLNMSWVFSD